jgi:SAM-dependent methyltransferase
VTDAVRNLACPVCHGSKLEVRAGLVPDLGTERYRAIACGECGLVFADPMPRLSFGAIQDVYGAHYIDEQSAMSESGASLEIVRRATHRQMEIVERCVRPGVALNVGATSEAIRVLAERGWQLRLVEASAYSAGKARASWGFDVVTARIEDYECAPASLDFVKLGHVIEHLADPVAVLGRIARMLRPGGVVLVDTDNARGLRSRLEISIRALLGEDRSAAIVRKLTGKNLRKRYGTLAPPVHLYAFTRASLRRVLESSGFEVVKMWEPAIGDPTWFPITKSSRLSPAERAMLHISRIGGLVGAGDVVAALAKRR